MYQKENGLSMEMHKRQTNHRTDDLAEMSHLVQRVIRQDDREACFEFERHFGETIHDWLHRHPLWETACRYGSEEYYLTLAFERFRQVSMRQLVALRTLTEALACLRASLNAVLLETLRAHKQPEPVSGPVEALLPMETSQELWERLQSLLENNREQRLFFLLYHCGLQPAEIVRLYPQEWSDIQEIYRLRHTILERLCTILTSSGSLLKVRREMR